MVRSCIQDTSESFQRDSLHVRMELLLEHLYYLHRLEGDAELAKQGDHLLLVNIRCAVGFARYGEYSKLGVLKNMVVMLWGMFCRAASFSSFPPPSRIWEDAEGVG